MVTEKTLAHCVTPTEEIKGAYKARKGACGSMTSTIFNQLGQRDEAITNNKLIVLAKMLLNVAIP